MPLAAVAIGISLLLPAGRHQWALSLIRQPAHYTILSFDHPSALPSRAVINRPIRVSFMIGNREGRLLAYQYVLSQHGGGASQVLGESARTIGAGDSWKVSTTVRPSCHTSPCRIEVSLPGHPEVIDFVIRLLSRGA
jgi:hypothetical protein